MHVGVAGSHVPIQWPAGAGKLPMGTCSMYERAYMFGHAPDGALRRVLQNGGKSSKNSGLAVSSVPAA